MKAKQNLIDHGLQYEEVILGKDATTVSLRAISGRTTVPQVFIGGKHIGGSEELEAYLAKLSKAYTLGLRCLWLGGQP